MSIFSIQSLIAFWVVAIVFQLIPGKRARQIWIALINIAFLESMAWGLRNAIAFCVIIAGSFLILRSLRKRPSGLSVSLAIAAVVLIFLVLKKYTFWDYILPARLSLEHRFDGLMLVGLSYMLFKFIHMVIDQWQDQLMPYTLASYANYQLGFFTLVAGPIQRYNDFQGFWESIDTNAPDDQNSLQGWSRILTGMIKLGIISAFFWKIFESAGEQLKIDQPGNVVRTFITYFYAYPFYMYFNFSGYTDIMIGCAQQLGMKLPENFNYPFLARNVFDYWNRWHISLTHWIRDYIFMASYKQVIMTAPALARGAGYLLIFFSLFVAGVWHGSTGAFAVFGAIHGIGAAASRMYGDILQEKLSPENFEKYQNNNVIHAVAILFTFHFVCFCFLFFSSGIGPTLDILHLVRTDIAMHSSALIGQIRPGLIAVALAGCVLYLGLTYAKSFDNFGRKITNRIDSASAGLYLVLGAKTAIVVVALLLVWALNENEPVVAYMKF